MGNMSPFYKKQNLVKMSIKKQNLVKNMITAKNFIDKL